LSGRFNRIMKPLPLILIAALALTACGDSRPKVEAPVTPVAGERLVVRESVIADLKPVAATVTTRDMGEARARIGGTLTKLLVREGDEVRKGQLLAVVSDQRLKFETTAYAAQVAAAEGEAARASADLKRIRTLYDQGIYAKARLDQADAAAKAANGALNAARAQRAASAELDAQGAILAPASGRVLKADVPAGSVVGQGQAVVTVTAGEPLLRVEVPEAQARALHTGEAIPIVTEDLPGVGPYGVIAQVYPAITNGRVVADIKVPGLRADLVGQRVRVQVKVGSRTALVVPQRFVATRYGLDFARVLGPKGVASDVAVQIGPGPAAGQVEVLSGLTAGDVILAQGPGR
jgi:RND family efflux transporter MFP subunit